MKLSVHRIIVACCCIAANYPTAGYGQKSDIRGIVSDSLTGQRLPFANVTVVGTGRGASANVNGFYLIPNLPPGDYEVAATVMGYRQQVKRALVVVGRALDLNFQLASKPVEGKEVLVTAARKREITEINTSVHVLERSELKAAPVLTQEDVFQSLKILPGIISTSDVSSKFYVRGGAGDQNLVLFDGMKIYNPFHAFGIFSVFDPDIIQNVEMYTGAFPAGYGGRLSSVVNMTTRDGRADKVAGSANLNLLSSKILLEGPGYEGSSWMINGRKSLFSETFKRIVNQDLPVSFYDMVVKFTHQFRQGTKVDFDFLSSGDRLSFNNPDEPDYAWRGNTFGLMASDLIGNRLFVNLVVYNSVYNAERIAKSSSVITPTSTTVKEAGIRVVANYYTDAQDLFFFGFEFSFPTLQYKLINNAGSNVDNFGSFADATTWMRYQAKYDRLQVDAGVHLDVGSILQNEQGLEAVQPRLNLSYLLFGTWRGKLSLGTFSQRVVTVSNEDDVISIFDPWIKIPANLQPEQSIHEVLGLAGNLSEPVFLDVQAYHKSYNRLVVYNRDKIDATEPDYITGTGRSYGVEMMLRCGFPFADLYAAYSVGWTTLRNGSTEYYPRHDRRHHINLMATTHPDENVDITARWEFGSGFPFTQSVGFYDRLRFLNAVPGPFEREAGEAYLALGEKNAARLPTYHRLDLSVAYRLALPGGIRATLGGQLINVYDSKNILYFDRRTGQRVNMLRFFPSATLTVSR